MKKSMLGLAILGIGIAIFAGYDAFQNWNCPDHSIRCTASYLLWFESYYHPVIPALISGLFFLLIGHIFWNTNPSEPPDPNHPPE